MSGGPCAPGCACGKHVSRPHRPETRAKIAAAHQARAAIKSIEVAGARNPMYGRTHTQEARARIAAARWKGGSTTTAHARVSRRYGRAATWTCAAECGSQAKDWAYLGGAADEQQGPFGPYSLNPDRYVPLCRSCHKNFDNARRAAA